jgi:hypothetical protein
MEVDGMLSGHRSARRRRGRSSRAARIAVPLAVPMALGLTLGIMIAVSGNNGTHITQSVLGHGAVPAASASARGPAAAPQAADAARCAPGRRHETRGSARSGAVKPGSQCVRPEPSATAP